MASSKASTASPGDSGFTPRSAILSQRPPAPAPSTKRPLDSADNEVTVRASTGAGRAGRLVTLASPASRRVAPSTNPDGGVGVQALGQVGVVGQREQVEPVVVGLMGQAEQVRDVVGQGVG